MTLELTLPMEVDFKYSPGSMSYYSPQFGNYLPGDPPEINIKSVKINDVEMISRLTSEQIEEIEEMILEDIGDS